MINVLDDKYIRFADKHDPLSISLDGTARAIWTAKMIVKIKSLKNLDKRNNFYMTPKQFSKLGRRHSFKKRKRNLNTELSMMLLCAGRLETGALRNTHVEQKPEYNIFNDKYSNFDSQLFKSATMLYNLLDMLRDKFTKFLYLLS